MGLSDVSTILWEERRLLEQLVFKLEEQRLLLASGSSRFLHLATDELDAVMEELRHVELLRAIAVDELHPGASLAQLADGSPEPWDDLLRQHREALLLLADEVRDRSQQNCEALARGEAAVRELLQTASPDLPPGSPGLLVDVRG